MSSGLYERAENFFNKKMHSLVQIGKIFLKDNYLFFCLFLTFAWLSSTVYPGILAYDSFSIYSNAFYNHVGTWHSALLTRFWQCLIFFTNMRGIFMFIQLGCIFLGLYLIGKHISKGILTGIICVLILFIPPVFSHLFVVLKDTYLAAFIFLIAALLFDLSLSDKNKTCLFSIGCGIILIACFYVRSNGCFIAVPLLVAVCIGWKSPIIYRYIICFALVLCVIATTPFVDLKLLKAGDEAPDFSVMIFDIIGTAKKSGQTTLPDIPEIPDQMAIIMNCYNSLQWDSVAQWSPKDNCNAIASHYYSMRDAGRKSLKQARKELRKAWITAITEHPLAYLKHRISHFNRFINYSGHHPVFQPLFIKVLGFTDFDFHDQNGPLTYKKAAPMIWEQFIHMDLEDQLWFHPYVSLLILLFFYLSTLYTNDRFNRTLNVVAFSGFIYLVGFLFVGVSSDFRYSYPSLLLSILCILAAFAFFSQKREIFGTRKTRMIAASITVPLFLIGIIL